MVDEAAGRYDKPIVLHTVNSGPKGEEVIAAVMPVHDSMPAGKKIKAWLSEKNFKRYESPVKADELDQTGANRTQTGPKRTARWPIRSGAAGRNTAGSNRSRMRTLRRHRRRAHDRRSWKRFHDRRSRKRLNSPNGLKRKTRWSLVGPERLARWRESDTDGKHKSRGRASGPKTTQRIIMQIATIIDCDGKKAELLPDGRWVSEDKRVESCLNILCSPGGSGIGPECPNYGKREAREAAVLLGARSLDMPEGEPGKPGTVY